jgi:hypothetical protein
MTKSSRTESNICGYACPRAVKPRPSPEDRQNLWPGWHIDCANKARIRCPEQGDEWKARHVGMCPCRSIDAVSPSEVIGCPFSVLDLL